MTEGPLVFKLYGNKARAVKENMQFVVSKVYTIEGHPVAELEEVYE